MLDSLRRRKVSAFPVLVARFVAFVFLLLLAGEFGLAHAAGIALVQHASKDGGTTTTSSLAFASANTSGNWIAVAIRGGLSSSQVFTVIDSNGNTYKQAGQVGFTASAVTTAVYYAENVKGGANTVTVSMTVSGPLRFAVLEYSGVATSNSLDGAAVSTGVGTSATSGNVTTTANGDLLLGAVATADSSTFTAGTGFTIRDSVPVVPNVKLISEDQIQASAGVAAATATLASSSNWGAVLVAVKAPGGVAGSPATITATGGTPQSATVSTAFGASLQATVKDSFSNPVSGAVVTFTAPTSGATGTFAGGVNTATTNASGVATSATFTANGFAGGPYTVVASITGATSANFSLTNTAGPAAKVTATSGSAQSAAINVAFAAPLVATVTDATNNPVSGVVVTFTAPGSGASGTFANGTVTTTATTNSSGVATSSTFKANATAGGPYTVVAIATGATSANYSLTNTSAPPATVTATSGSGQSATISTAFGAALVATVRDAGTNPVSGVVVTFTAPASSASGTFANGTATTTATTNASGVATSTTFTANTVAGGPYNVVASVTGATSANFSMTNTVGAAAKVVVTSGSGQSAVVSTAFAAPLVATVTDSGNNPVSGVVVTFTPPASGASGTFAGGANTATSNASGVATSVTFTANATTGGPYIVVASATGATSANFALTNVTNAPANIALVQHASVDGGTTTSSTLAFPSANTTGNWIAVAIRGGLSSTQVFTVKDSNGNTYKQGGQIGFTASAVTTAIYYAENIKGGANTVTVTMTVSGPLRFAILEYSGVATSNSLDGAAANTGAGTSATTANVTTTSNGDLLLDAVATADSSTFTPGTGYTIRDSVPVAPNVKLITEDQIQPAAGVTSGSATLASSSNWGIVLLAVKAPGGVAGSPSTISATGGAAQNATVNTAFGAALQATVKDSFNNPVSGVVVTFAAPSSGASGTFAGGVNTATTNASGVATSAAFTANTIAGGYNVTASATGVSTPASFSLTNLAGAAASVTATAGASQSAAINTAFATQLQATVRDSFSNPVSGIVVTFTAPASGASGTFAGGVITATTNASGVATSAIFTANAIAGGPYNVVASATGATSANFSLTNTAGAAAKVAATSGFGQSATINTAFAAPLVATVTDAGNNPVSGVVVTFTAPASSASGKFANGTASTTATTNASGVATSTTFTANATAGPYNVVASATGATSASFSLTNTVGAPAKVAVTSGSGQSAAINTAFGAALIATVTDSGNNPVSGVVVTFTPPASGASGTFAGGVNTATTNASGVATSVTFTANATSGGPYNIVASATGATSANFALTNTSAAAAKVAVTSGSGQSAAINTAFGAALVATVTDAGSNPVSGAVVTFTAPSTGASGTFAGGVNTATTNASGVATSAAFTANAIAGGPYNVVASVTGATSANFSLTNTVGPAAKVAVTTGSAQSATVNTAFTALLVATVTDAGNNPVSGVVVTFTAPSTGASGTFAGGVNTATTNASGVATSAIFTANAIAGGPYNVVASATGATSANFSLTNTAGAAANVAATSGSGQTASINTAFAAPLVATVTDAGSNPVSGVVVTFTAPASGASGTFAGGVNTATTNASGVATSAVFTANATAGGPYNVVASATGATSANFALTNQASQAANIVLVQHTSVDGGTTTSSTLAFPSANTTGNWIAVAIRGGLSSTQVFTVKDSNGNTYKQAGQVGFTVSAVTTAIYYAENIKGGANTVTVTMSVSGPLRFAILEYSGVATSNSLDVAAAITGVGAAPNSGNVTTTANGDLLLTAIGTADSSTFTPGTGYTIRDSVPVAPNTKLITEDQVQTAAGVASGSATLAATSNWGVILAAVKPAGAAILPPSIASLNPNAGPVATPVTITGTNFGSATGTVTFNSIPATPTTWTPTSIVVPVPTGATTGNVVVTANGFTSNGVLFTVTTSPSPTISTLSLTQGPIGANLSVNGANFGSTQGTVTFNGVTASIASWSTSIINVSVPTGATTGNVVVSVGGLNSNGVLFTVTPIPNITSISPTSGPIGTNVIITGTNFGPTVGTIQSFVQFNGTQTRTNSWSDTSINAPVPTGSTTGSVIVFVGGVPSNGVTFTVTAAPSITSLNPTFGPVGTSITITGANFGATQLTNTITFNGLPATPTSWSATSIVAPVPSGATSGNVVVTISGVPSNGVNFTVTAGSGNIALVQHVGLDAGSTTSASLAFSSNNSAGNWIGVLIRAGTSTAEVFTVTDSKGNTYHQAYQFTLSATAVVFSMYYAENINGGPNTVMVSDTASGPLRFAIVEFSGVATSNSLDATPVAAQGFSATPNSGTLTTGANGDLLLGMAVSTNTEASTPGSGYTVLDVVPASPGTKLTTEMQIQPVAGTASAGVTLINTDNWGAGLAAVRSISGQGFPITVTVTPHTASIPTGYGTQTFSGSIANDFQNKGITWSLSGAGCTGNACGTFTLGANSTVSYAAPLTMPSPAVVTLTATSVADNTKSDSATITIVQGVLTVVVSPKRGALTLGGSQTIQFSDTVFNDTTNAGVTWQVDGNNGGNATTGTVSTTGLFVPGTQVGQHTVKAVSNANAFVSGSATVAVTNLAGVYTYHNDAQRTGQNIQEYGLNTSTVNSSTFGQLFTCPVDGFVYAQPLWVANVNIGGTMHNVVYVATEHDSVYAFDADSPSCVPLWNAGTTGKVSFLGTGVTTLVPSDINGNGDIVPEVGVTSTPVIDPSTNTLYVLPKTKETVGTVNGQTCTTAAPCFVHRLHALDLATGAEKFGGPVVIVANNFGPFQHLQRPALLLANNTVYVAFGSHGDQCSYPTGVFNYQGWVMGYNASNLTQTFASPLVNPLPNQGCLRAGIWMAGAGPAADTNGNIYVSTGNGNYNGANNFGDTAMKMSPTGSFLDWFTPFNQSVFNANDIDLGSGGILILPSSVTSAAHPNLAIATGKVAILYLLDTTSNTPSNTTMGQFNSSSNNDVQEVIPVPPPNTTLLDGGNYSVPAYWNGNLYTTGQNFPLSQFQISNGTITTPQSAKSPNTFPPRGGIPSVSANGTTGGVVWVIDFTGWQNGNAAVLDAYDATNVGTLLYSSPASGIGSIAPAVKFAVPTVANGKVYVGAQQSISVFGLLPN